ncbi:MAG: winged helix-turn-helix domain-containing protein, partial [Pseudonocardia sp.]|nr:winged helix-turn-helix domain-containing protein [Pseudonocardia sp.]
MVAPALAFGVLGALEAHRDGIGVPVSSARQRAVLAALLAGAGRPVPGDALIDAAWGDDLPASPRPALHTLLSRLRAALGPAAIHSEPAGYRLAIRPDAVDAARFEALRDRAARAPA